MSQPLTAHFGKRYFDTTLIADHSPMLHSLVLAAQAFPIGHRAKDAGAEKPVALRFERAVIDGLRLGYLSMGPAPDLLRRCQADSNGIEVGNGSAQVKWTGTVHSVLLRFLRQSRAAPGHR